MKKQVLCSLIKKEYNLKNVGIVKKQICFLHDNRS
jgi:hypothetical protein